MKLSVSDHAVMRYIERVHGVNVNKIRACIAKAVPAGVVAAAQGGTVRYKTPECTFVIADNKVVTTHAHKPAY